MPFGNGTSQSQVSAGGDVVAGNLNRTTTSHNYFGSSGNSRVDYLAALGRQFLAEQEQNQGIGHIIDKLLRYSTPVQEEATLMIGLESKLEEGGYVPYMHFAAQTKEHFTKHLFKYQFSESAQKMYAFLLAKVYTCFGQHVYPAIVQGSPPQEVMQLVEVHVYAKIVDCLGENILELYDDEIAGMLFYLTGNCHIKWR
ncbi:ABC-three component system protein [Hymenobacter metallicola]|uniref:ABC-three component systems C-terminal domain-containing protein n=1 Tax=Hymenobacter metallicola TaxID=2563114 RepID=A0A4Z0Q0P9_9BACT|nr:ABC-three component system protein [Hymenobacter metallicola]TGE22661.1 hypothetical protein E5K02_23295 [Hymenobacter metallicola]